MKTDLERADERYQLLWAKFNKLWAENDRRGAIIAVRILGWKKHELPSGQECYAPSERDAAEIRLGDNLSRFVDEAISNIKLEGEDR